jgi:TM2 domain-containing membrane protein YozV
MSNTASTGESEPGPGEVYCRDCGTVISERAEICPNCGVRQRDPPKGSLDTLIEELTASGNPFIAAVLSVVFPGLGQLYNRELEKGLVIMVASVVALVSVVVGVGILLYPAVWIYALWDAYKVAERQSDEEPDTVVERHVGSSSDEDETEESS